MITAPEEHRKVLTGVKTQHMFSRFTNGQSWCLLSHPHISLHFKLLNALWRNQSHFTTVLVQAALTSLLNEQQNMCKCSGTMAALYCSTTDGFGSKNSIHFLPKEN